MTRDFLIYVFVLSLVSMTALPVLAQDDEEPAWRNRPELHYLGVHLGLSQLGGESKIVVSDASGNNPSQDVMVPNADLFHYATTVGLTFGMRPEGTDFMGFGELLYFHTSLHETADVSPFGTISLAGDDVSLYFLKAGISMFFQEITTSRFVPSVGISGQIGTKKATIVDDAPSAISVGPFAAIDFRLGPVGAGPRFVTTHVEIEYNHSFSDGWPSMVTVSAGLRFFWK